MKENILKINSKMLSLERDCAISYDETFGEVFKDIYQKYPDTFREITGESKYISERERCFMRWSLETVMVDEGRTKDQKDEIRKRFSHLYKIGLNYFHPETYDTIVVVGGDSNER